MKHERIVKVEPYSPNNTDDQQGKINISDPDLKAPPDLVGSSAGQVFSPSPSADLQPPANPGPNEYQTQPISGQPVYTAPITQQTQPFSPNNQQYAGQNYDQAYGNPPLGAIPANPQSRGPKRKKSVVFGVLTLLLILGALGGVFGYYLPNKPENVYRTGLSRSGEVLEKLANQTAETDNLEKYQNGDFSGRFEFKDATNKVSGDTNAKFNAKKINANLNADLVLEGEPAQKYNAKLLSEIAEGKEFPTTYFQIAGIPQLGLEELIPGINVYDNKWIVVNESYVKSLSDTYGALLGDILRSPDTGGDRDVTDEQKPQITKEDIQEITKVTMALSREYVFNDDTSKSILVQKSYEGKEKSGDINTHRYKMGLNKQNTVNFCKAMIDRMSDTTAFKKFNKETPIHKEEEKENLCDPLREEIDEIYTFDMFVDTKYKLIHKFRFALDKDNKSYVDIGQRYRGGDLITIFIGGHDEESKTDTELSAEINTKTNTTNFSLFAKSLSEEDNYDISGTFEAKPLIGDVPLEKPTDAIKIEEILQKLGVDPEQFLNPSGGLQSNSNDTKRQNDITLLAVMLNEYASNHNGKYPSLVNMNKPAWRTTNLPGLEEDVLKDPEGTTTQLSAAPAARQYAYVASGCVADLCKDYSLIALLSDGSPYTIDSL